MTTTDKKLLDALSRILRPVVRVLVGKNLPLGLFIDLIKKLYVETAAECLAADGKKATDSQISIMTGVHRKDVKELRTPVDVAERVRPRLSMGAELIARWMAEPAYLDEGGAPRPLAYAAADTEEKTFSTLAAQVSKDVRPRALLDDLLRLGAVGEDAVSGIVTLRAEALVPREDWDQKLHYFAQNGGDHLEAAVTNILADKPRFMDRSVYHDGLTAESVAELQQLSGEAGMKALRQVNRKAFELSTRDKNRADATHRINLGVFFFTSGGDKDKPR